MRRYTRMHDISPFGALVSASPSPLALRPAPAGPSRRAVVGAGVWSAPALALASSAPAFAAASGQQVITLSTPEFTVPSSGAVTVSTTVTDAQGAPVAGALVSLTGPSGSWFGAADGTTDGSGVYETKFDLSKTWAKPGSSISLTAVSGSATVSQSFTVRGANALGWGYNHVTEAGIGDDSIFDVPTPTQLARVFPEPITSLATATYGATFAVLQDGSVWSVGYIDNAGVRGGGLDKTSHSAWTTWVPFSGLSDVQRVACAYNTAFALKTDGSLWSWGEASNGLLGDGTSNDRSTPVQILSDVKDVAVGIAAVYALLSDGSVVAWGDNAHGRLGDGTTTAHSTPAGVSGLTADVVQVAAHDGGGYALKTDGSVWAWGANDSGQCAIGGTSDQLTPVQVSLSTAATQVAGSLYAGYALLADGTVAAWGNNLWGQLGDGTQESRATAAAVANLSNVVQISAVHRAAYALTADGGVWSWGDNQRGELGQSHIGSGALAPMHIDALNGIPVTTLIPVNGSPTAYTPFVIVGDALLSVDVLETFVSAGTAGTVMATVASGSAGVAGVDVSLSATSGAVLDTTQSQTDAYGTVETIVRPDQWTKPGSVVRVTARTASSEASDVFTVLGSNVVATGEGDYGQFGDGDPDRPAYTSARQLPVVFPAPVLHGVSSRHAHACVVLADGSVWTAGNGNDGTLGDGDTSAHSRDTWQVVNGLSSVVQVASSWGALYALTSSGEIYGWGTNFAGQLGYIGGFSGEPALLQGISGALQIACSGSAVHAVMPDGSVLSVGENRYGQFGVGNTTNSETPVKMSGVSTAVQVAAANDAVYVLLADGTVVSCGRGEHGEAGQGIGANTTTPKPIAGLTGVTAVASFNAGGYALLSDGTVRAWGVNDNGAVGNGSAGDGTAGSLSVGSPVAVTGLSDVARVAGGYQSGFALLKDGSVRAWGLNSRYELGDGTTTTRPTPQVLDTGGHPVSSLNGHGVGGSTIFFALADTSVSVDVAEDELSAGGDPGTVTAKVAAGSAPVAGAAITLSATPGAALQSTSGTSDASGTVQSAVAVEDRWATPGNIARVTASSGSSTGSDTFTVLGANALGFGYNAWTEMGDGGAPGGDDAGTGVARTSPSQLLRVFPAPITQVVSCGAGNGGGSNQTTLVLLKDGTVWSVGGNGFGQLGTAGNSRSAWAKIPGLSRVTQLSAGNVHVYALLEDGTVKGWGDNYAGQLGTGVSGDSATTPVTVVGLSNVVQISSGTQQGYFLLEDGTVRAIGRNTFSAALGNGSSVEYSATPVTVSNLSNVAQIAGGHQCGYALKSDGTVWAWGANDSGRLGDGTTPVPGPWVAGQTTPAQSTPVQVQGLSGKLVTQVVGNRAGGIVLLSDGAVMAWGDNSAGSVGDGTTTSRSSAVQVSFLTAGAGVVQIAASGASGYARLYNGTAGGWGANANGQLGDGSTTDRTQPVQIPTWWPIENPVRLVKVVGFASHSPSTDRMYFISE